ncbi:hypothetical protein UK15_07715 [Streptomyces variegatus]|uniref:Scaffolding protein n=1 Tax=Streptomyces variegatus TaxID=284040 RepID=A0A0M2GVR6_9ACTN|nr:MULTISPECIES: hypothetical protein [Streptomyces]KJK40230.1 hypothetical protein UK15_07715 [Streptomyces variegatus]
MQKRTLPRLAGSGWAHPYATGPFDPWLYADGGDGDDSGSGSDDSDETEDGDASDQDDDAASDDDQDDADDADDGKDDDTNPKPKPPAKKAATGASSRRDKELEKARDQAAKARVGAKEAADKAKKELVHEIGKALGLVEDEKDEAPDPAKLQTEIERRTAAHRETAVELAVYRGASKYGADPDALTDSRGFLNSIKGLDPEDEGFAKAVSAAIKKAVDDNPKLKAAAPPPDRTSSDFNGGAGGSSEPEDIDEIRAARRKRRAG